MSQGVAGVRRALAVLIEALSRRLPSDDEVDPNAAREADRKRDASWAALHGLFTAWARVGDIDEAETAKRLLALVFPAGLAFLNLSYRQAWATSDALLRSIHTNDLAERIESLGGAKLLKRLRRAHREHGATLGITKPVERVPGAVSVGEACTKL